jgi:chromosome segregation ATPase
VRAVSFGTLIGNPANEKNTSQLSGQCSVVDGPHCRVVCRDNFRLKGEKLNDTRFLTKKQKAINDLSGKLEQQQIKSNDLQRKLTEQKDAFEEKHSALQDVRSRVAHLETVELVMSDRAQRYEQEVGPRRAEVAHLTSQRAVQDQELARCLRLVASLKIEAGKKDAYIKCAPLE